MQEYTSLQSPCAHLVMLTGKITQVRPSHYLNIDRTFKLSKLVMANKTTFKEHLQEKIIVIVIKKYLYSANHWYTTQLSTLYRKTKKAFRLGQYKEKI